MCGMNGKTIPKPLRLPDKNYKFYGHRPFFCDKPGHPCKLRCPVFQGGGGAVYLETRAQSLSLSGYTRFFEILWFYTFFTVSWLTSNLLLDIFLGQVLSFFFCLVSEPGRSEPGALLLFCLVSEPGCFGPGTLFFFLLGIWATYNWPGLPIWTKSDWSRYSLFFLGT